MNLAVEERLDEIEARTAALEAKIEQMGGRAAAPATFRQWEPPRPRIAVPAREPEERVSEPGQPEQPAAPKVSFEDLVGGRLLAWVGGAALLLGVAFFLALAVSHGWLGEAPRCLLAAAAGVGLLGASVRLRERGARQEAVLTAAGSALGMLFVDVSVAARGYELVDPFVATALALVVGAIGVVLAIRWEAKPVGALGILGGLVAPALAGAPTGGSTIVLLLVAATAAGAVLVQQRWDWLGLAAFAVTAPQVISWLDHRPDAWAVIAALTVLGVVTTCQAIGFEVQRAAEDVRPSAAFLLAANALLLAVGGHWALGTVGHEALADAWLVVLATAHGAVGFGAVRSSRVSTELRLLTLAIGLVLADVALGAITSGVVLPVAFAVSAVGFAVVSRALRSGSHDALAARAGLGVHVLLAAGHALVVDAPPDGVTDVATAGLALGAVAAASFAAGRVAVAPRPVRVALDTLALGTLAYLAALTLDPLPLVLAWSAEAVALAKLWRRTDDEVAGLGALAHLGGATAVALVWFAPPAVVLTEGFPDLLGAVAALGAVAGAAGVATRLARTQEQVARGLAAVAAIETLLLVSGVVVTAAGGGQTGQMWLSGLWAASGAIALIAGLLGGWGDVRRGALLLLSAAIVKVFILDLAGLDSAYRAVSFIALGVVLLGTAFAWQRLRPLPAGAPS